MKAKKLSDISKSHYIKLVYRSLLFVLFLTAYIASRIQGSGDMFWSNKAVCLLLALIWIVYMVEMVLRFFCSKLESPGSQKQFKRNFIPTDEKTPSLVSWKRTFAVVAAWFALNGVIGGLYFAGIIDRSVLILVSLAYGICDMICILFFCPFQSWFLKNRCCADCRIYNWDFAMMFTPCIFIPDLYTWSLLGVSLLLLLRWEITLRTHPERFSKATNACISCKNCKEKLCAHKKQLRSFWKKNKMDL